MVRKVLLVDDDKALRDTFKKGLEAYSDTFTLELAEDGTEAIEKLKGQDILLVITDLKMPRTDGFSLLAHVMEHYPETPVIVITGYGTPQMKRMAQQGGAVGYIEKPFMIEDLAQSILTHLRKVSEGGTLHHVSSGMFLQLIEMEQKTCTIRVSDKDTGKHGILYFMGGQLLDAKTDAKRGEEAAHHIFSWDDVSISIQNSCSVKEQKIKGDVQAILLEAMRLKDENSKSDLGMPDLEEEPEEPIEIVPPAKTVEEKKPISPPTAKAKPQQPIPNPPQQPTTQTNAKTKTAPVETSTLEKIREKITRSLGDRSGLNDIYIDSTWNNFLNQLQTLGQLFNSGKLKLGYLDRGDKSDLVLIPGQENMTLSLKPKCPRDKIIQLLSE